MEIQSKLEKKTIEATLLTIRISLDEKDRLIEILKSLKQKSKLDRLEEYFMNKLIGAFEHPETETSSSLNTARTSSFSEEIKKEIPETPYKEEEKKIDRIFVVNKIKSQTDPQNKENINEWIKGSIKFAQTQMNIKTIPKSESIEDFYDWLLANFIIDVEGNPLARK